MGPHTAASKAMDGPQSAWQRPFRFCLQFHLMRPHEPHCAYYYDGGNDDEPRCQGGCHLHQRAPERESR